MINIALSNYGAGWRGGTTFVPSNEEETQLLCHLSDIYQHMPHMKSQIWFVSQLAVPIILFPLTSAEAGKMFN